MPNKVIHATVTVAVVFALSFSPADGRAQRERTVPAATEDDTAYGGKFFDQLRSIFGRFRNTDLERAFQGASPIRCSELASNKGEWRPVAFFNENRKLGDWYRATIEEVRSDLAVYTFKGSCSGDRAPLQLTTKFPVDESIDAFNAGRIPFENIDLNVNPPVSVVFDPRTEAYTFELPFLFLREKQDSGNIYSLIAPRLSAPYARDVTDHWDCKAVTAEDVTYQFLICRTMLTDRDVALRSQRRQNSFGSSAFFILSDGKEARSSVRLSFGGGEDTPDSVGAPGPATPVAPTRESPVSPTPGAPSRREVVPEPAFNSGWRMPDFWSKLSDLERQEFRLVFSPQTWSGKIGSPQLLVDQKMTGSDGLTGPSGSSDFCIWRPSSSRTVERLIGPDPESVALYSLATASKTAQSPTAVAFRLKTLTGQPLGTLECYFPRADSPATISFDRWVTTVGAHITLEVRR